MPKTIEVVRNDKGYDLVFTLQDAGGNPLNLTGANLTFSTQLQTASTVKFTGDMTIVNAQAGIAKYTVQATDFDTAGEYWGEITVNYPSTGEILTFTDLIIYVKPDLPR